MKMVYRNECSGQLPKSVRLVVHASSKFRLNNASKCATVCSNVGLCTSASTANIGVRNRPPKLIGGGRGEQQPNRLAFSNGQMQQLEIVRAQHDEHE